MFYHYDWSVCLLSWERAIVHRHKQHTRWVSAQLRVLATRPACSSGCQMTTPQGISVYLDGAHKQLTVSEHISVGCGEISQWLERERPARICLRINVRTAGINSFSVRVSVAPSHRYLHTTWGTTHTQRQIQKPVDHVFTAPSSGLLQEHTHQLFLVSPDILVRKGQA